MTDEVQAPIPTPEDETTTPVPSEPTPAPQPEKKPDSRSVATLARLTEIKDILSKIGGGFDKLLDGLTVQLPAAGKDEKKKGEDADQDKPEKKKKKDDTPPGLGASLKDFVKNLKTFLSARNLSQVFQSAKGGYSAARNGVSAGRHLGGGLSNYLHSVFTSTSKDEKKNKSEKSSKADTSSTKESSSLAQRISQTTTRIISDSVKKLTRITGFGKSPAGSTSSVLSSSTTANNQEQNTSEKSNESNNTSTHESLTSKVSNFTNRIGDTFKRLTRSGSSEGGAARGASGAARGVGTAVRAVGSGAGEAAGAAGAAGGGAAAGGAGAAAGAGEAAAAAAPALASNPVGWVIAAVLAIAAVVVALVALPFVIRSFANSMLEGQRKFAESSGAMAQVFAKKDVADTMRDMRVGDKTAGSAGGLSESLTELEDRIEPFTTMVTNFLNNVMTGFVMFATFIMDAVIVGINVIIDGINLMIPFGDPLSRIEVNTRKKDDDTDFGEFLNEWDTGAKAYRGGPANYQGVPPARGLGVRGVNF